MQKFYERVNLGEDVNVEGGVHGHPSERMTGALNLLELKLSLMSSLVIMILVSCIV